MRHACSNEQSHRHWLRWSSVMKALPTMHIMLRVTRGGIAVTMRSWRPIWALLPRVSRPRPVLLPVPFFPKISDQSRRAPGQRRRVAGRRYDPLETYPSQVSTCAARGAIVGQCVSSPRATRKLAHIEMFVFWQDLLEPRGAPIEPRREVVASRGD